MHYYKRNLGDYAKKAGRLSMLEHGAYTLLIDSCYDREQFPTKEEAIDWTWARTPEEVAAVEFVLGKFFTLEGDKYIQKRIQEELEAYHEKAKQNAKIAREREANRRKGKRNVHEPCTDGAQSNNESPPNQEPITNNQSNKKQAKKPSGKPLVTFPGWLDRLREAGEKPIPDDDPVFDYAERAGIPAEYLRATWVEFKARYSLVDKKYKDWRAVFNRAVRGNWFELWWHDGSGYQLTTKGRQAMAAMKNQEAA